VLPRVNMHGLLQLVNSLIEQLERLVSSEQVGHLYQRTAPSRQRLSSDPLAAREDQGGYLGALVVVFELPPGLVNRCLEELYSASTLLPSGT